MTTIKALGTVLLWAIVFALLGGLGGGMLGLAVPDYYRSACYHGHSPEFNPFHSGIGLGVMQGFGLGIVISLIVLTVLAWRDSRLDKPLGKDCEEVKEGRWTVFTAWLISTSLVVIICSAIAFFLGGLSGQMQIYRSWTDQKLEKVSAILDSEGISNLQVDYMAPVQVYLIGTLPSEETQSILHDKLVLAFGTCEANFILENVNVAEKPVSRPAIEQKETDVDR